MNPNIKKTIIESQSLTVIGWNCRSMLSRVNEFYDYLTLFGPDIVCLNEIKMDTEKASNFLRFLGYETIYKPRPTGPNNGGGVAIIIKESISYIDILALDALKLETIAIEIILPKNEKFLLVAHYNPPPNIISQDLFTKIESISENWMVIGDLNSKDHSFGCVGENPSGAKLVDILEKVNGIIINDNSPTYHNAGTGYLDILDLCICSPWMASKSLSFEVQHDIDMDSDHLPICATFSIGHKKSKEVELSEKRSYNFKKANWIKYRSLLKEAQIDTISEDLDKLNDEIIAAIKQAAEQSIPLRPIHPFKSDTLPPNILKTIHQRRKARKKLAKTNLDEDKKAYYRLSRKVKDIHFYVNLFSLGRNPVCGRAPVVGRPAGPL